MTTDIPVEAIASHNNMVFELSQKMNRSDFTNLIDLLRGYPLCSLAEIASITRLQDLFVKLMDHEYIGYGNYREFLTNLKKIKPSLCSIVKQYSEEINRIIDWNKTERTTNSLEEELNLFSKPGVRIRIDNGKRFSGYPHPHSLVIKSIRKTKHKDCFQCIVKVEREKRKNEDDAVLDVLYSDEDTTVSRRKLRPKSSRGIDTNKQEPSTCRKRKQSDCQSTEPEHQVTRQKKKVGNTTGDRKNPAATRKPQSEGCLEKVSPNPRTEITKFVGRKILHEWCVDEATGSMKLYKGKVLGVLKGKDGQPDAKYEVLYEGEDDSYEVGDLHQNLNDSFLKFIDD
ncbi:uncharacterized protein LOC117322908 [Pecten maximus]|uniref:uncharacterized protein LOC117322908 n=1 Tax=Pecten maximus TaxID=6579 RepID=UPI001458F55F|nr:uncharacterized protein LOC117322908 [Pecten maximus]XP_033733748.1 uncharacterized protein LOC117322908 [Pecten maximus]XP_033733749.1 uncharacterized protein LOC117322908 [Pecten maximus]